ncbi:MAG: PEP-CTERM sorting domain-containing protein [Syntrophobacteraceae bacterium]|nr:PEP-CTERM sorting domain-containing protein [Syntrophobacteraceae bacterium]
MGIFKNRLALNVLFLAFALQSIALCAAQADVIYTYTGNQLTTGASTLGACLDATVTLSSAPSNNGWVNASDSITQVTVTALGSTPPISLTEQGPDIQNLFISFMNGSVYDWSFELANASYTIHTSPDYDEVYTNTAPFIDDKNASRPGTWTQVPEPGTLALLALGLLGPGALCKLGRSGVGTLSS